MTPSVWQTPLGREMGARTAHCTSMGRDMEYWVTPSSRRDLDPWVEGITKNGPEVLVGLSELNLSDDGLLPRVDTLEATKKLDPFQLPNRVTVKEGQTDFSTQTEGGKNAHDDEYGSEILYGVKRYPLILRMFSREVDDVMVKQYNLSELQTHLNLHSPV